MNDPTELHLPIREGGEAVDVLAAASGLSKRALKQAMTLGAVWLERGKTTRRLRRGSATVRAGDTLHLYHDPVILGEAPPQPRLLADEGQSTVWFKPYGLRSQGSKWGDHCTIGRWSERHLRPERPAFVVHRLDRAASGLILLAHGKEAANAFSGLFRQRAIEKRYQVIVQGAFPGDAQLYQDALDGKEARSTATLIRHDPDADRSLLEVQIETGRKHQIRRHLATAGFPVVGDRLHGRGAEDGVDLQLSAVQLSFQCPLTGVERRYELPPELRLDFTPS